MDIILSNERIIRRLERQIYLIRDEIVRMRPPQPSFFTFLSQYDNFVCQAVSNLEFICLGDRL